MEQDVELFFIFQQFLEMQTQPTLINRIYLFFWRVFSMYQTPLLDISVR